MWLRIAGILVVLFGVAFAALGIAGSIHGPSLAILVDAAARSPGVSDFDYCTWLKHWRAWGIAMGCAGGAVAASGTALFLRRRWGFFLFAAILTLVAAAPWLIQASGMARYGYERTSAAKLTRLFLVSQIEWTQRDPCDVAYEDGTKQEQEVACQMRAQSGGPNAEFSYGLILWSGHDRASDHRGALEWIRKSARQGHLLAQVTLGEFLSHPEVEPELRNPVEAYAWWIAAGETKAAERLLATLSPTEADAARLLSVEYRSKYAERRPAINGP
jgi:hypothetical protein